MKITDQLRRIIQDCGKSRYRLAKLTGVSQAALSRFVNGLSGIGGESIDALADVLGLDLAPRPAATKATGRKATRGK